MKRYPGRNHTVGYSAGPGSTVVPEPCSAQICMWIFADFSHNKWLEVLHLAPRIEFIPALEVQNGILIGRAFTYVSYDGQNSAFSSVDQGNGNHRAPFWVQALYAQDGKPNRIYIKMTPGVSPEQFASAWKVNLTCLSKLGGCPDRTQILPPGSPSPANLGPKRSNPICFFI